MEDRCEDADWVVSVVVLEYELYEVVDEGGSDAESTLILRRLLWRSSESWSPALPPDASPDMSPPCVYGERSGMIFCR